MEKNNHERTEELLEILRNFRLLDDTFFSQCFDGNNECTELILRIILDMTDLKVLRTNTQRSVKNFMLHEARVATDNGPMFGPNGEGDGFQRLNFACPRQQLDAALERIASALERRGLAK